MKVAGIILSSDHALYTLAHPLIPMALSSPVKAEIRGMLETYARCYEEKDLAGILSLVSPDICGFGSGPDEMITGRGEFEAQIARDFAQADQIAVRFANLRIHGAMPVA